MPHLEPLQLDRPDIELIRHALEFYSSRWTRSDADGCPPNLADLRQRLETAVPVFPCYLLAWPGVTVAEMAPILSERSPEPRECSDCGSSSDALRGKACSSPGCPLVAAGVCFAPGNSGCAACDRGDYQLGHVEGCPQGSREGSGVHTKRGPYSARGAFRMCQVCKGTGDAGNAAIGHRICGDCSGTGRIISMDSRHVVSQLTDAQNDFTGGQAGRAFSTLLQVVGHLHIRLSTVEGTADRTAREASMRANGIQPD